MKFNIYSLYVVLCIVGIFGCYNNKTVDYIPMAAIATPTPEPVWTPQPTPKPTPTPLVTGTFCTQENLQNAYYWQEGVNSRKNYKKLLQSAKEQLNASYHKGLNGAIERSYDEDQVIEAQKDLDNNENSIQEEWNDITPQCQKWILKNK